MLRKSIFLIFITIFVTGCSIWLDTGKYDVVYVNKEKDSRVKQSEKEEQRKPFSIAIVPKLEGISYFDAVEKGAMEAAWDLDVQVIFVGSKDNKPESQEQIIRKLIEQEVDAIAVSANDPVKLLPVLQEARQHNIKVLTWDSDTDPAGRDYFVNPVNPETIGRRLMDTLAWSLVENGDFAIISSSLSAANSNDWIKWIKSQKNEYYPKMNLVEVVPSDDNNEKAYEEAKRLLKKYPHLRGIIGTSSVAPPAAARAIVEHKKTGSVSIVGLSTPNDMRSYIKDGVSPMITLWSPKKLGYLTVAVAKNLLEEQTPSDGQTIPKVGKISVKNDVITMGEAIDFTKENVDQYDF